jgi:hypothetical protein
MISDHQSLVTQAAQTESDAFTLLPCNPASQPTHAQF